jgi:sarcosine oxidase gamma subunit
MSGQTLEVLEVAPSSCFEMVELAGGVIQSLQRKSPGTVRVAADGRLEALHFSPGRWLLPDPSADLLAAIGEQSAVTLVDVEGKWQRRSLRGSGALRLLAAAADVEAMLTERHCAALSLFDCPCIVARGSGTIELWVQSSYARFLDAQLANALSRGRFRY